MWIPGVGDGQGGMACCDSWFCRVGHDRVTELILMCIIIWVENAKVKVLVTQSSLTLCDPMDCSSAGSSVHGILQARILEWVAIPFSRGIFLTQGLNLGLLHCRLIIYRLSYQGSLQLGISFPYSLAFCFSSPS